MDSVGVNVYVVVVAERFVFVGWLRLGVLFCTIVCCSFPRVLPRRATTRRAFCWGVAVAVRAVDVFVRGTTRRAADNGMVLTTVFIGFSDCDVVTPGFRFVRIWLFMYGYI